MISGLWTPTRSSSGSGPACSGKEDRSMRRHLFTSESVTEGYPDKLADQISDAVLDAIYDKDPNGRVACETLVTTGMAVVAGEISTSTYIEIPQVVRETIHNAGYVEPEHGFAYKTCGVVTAIQSQSPDIALGVDKGGAADHAGAPALAAAVRGPQEAAGGLPQAGWQNPGHGGVSRRQDLAHRSAGGKRAP